MAFYTSLNNKVCLSHTDFNLILVVIYGFIITMLQNGIEWKGLRNGLLSGPVLCLSKDLRRRFSLEKEEKGGKRGRVFSEEGREGR